MARIFIASVLSVLLFINFDATSQVQVGQTIYGPSTYQRAGQGVSISDDGMSIGVAYDQIQTLWTGEFVQVYEIL